MITEKDFKIDVSDKGPYLIKGGVTIVLPDGSREFKEKTVAFYRCGYSKKKLIVMDLTESTITSDLFINI